ncbi:hypothetical protein K5D52_07555 [Pseudomonas cichorii]|nr:hypothetical protein [Pseudomonas cichorii]
MSSTLAFSKRTKGLLRQEVGDYCSAPFCGVQTSVYDTKTLSRRTIGDAAHICGARKGGARYSDLPPGSARHGHENGVWLCAACHRVIDNNAELFPVETLRDWKIRAIQAHQDGGRTRRFSVTVGADITREHQKVVSFLNEILSVRTEYINYKNWDAPDDSGARKYLDTENIGYVIRWAAGRPPHPAWNAHHPHWSFVPDLRAWQDEIVRMAKTLDQMDGIRFYDREAHRLYFIKDEGTGVFTPHDKSTLALQVFVEMMRRFEEYLRSYAGPPQGLHFSQAPTQSHLSFDLKGDL